jgi:hypothetical protein
MTMHFDSPLPMYLKTILKYGYLDVIEINIFSISNFKSWSTKHFQKFLKYSSKNLYIYPNVWDIAH